jgi:hypothetical protein
MNTLDRLLLAKFNPNHDETGRFSSGDGLSEISTSKKMNDHLLAHGWKRQSSVSDGFGVTHTYTRPDMPKEHIRLYETNKSGLPTNSWADEPTTTKWVHEAADGSEEASGKTHTGLSHHLEDPDFQSGSVPEAVWQDRALAGAKKK